VFLYASDGAKKKQVPVYVNGDDTKPPWNGSPVYDINNHARHNGWVYKRRLQGKSLKKAGYTRDEIEIIFRQP